MRLIDADELKKDIDGYDYSEEGYSDRMDFEFIYEVIDNQPTVEAKSVIHGEWIRQKNSMGSWTHPTYRCSICGIGTNNDTKYCSECGASMEQWVYGKSKWE